MQNRQRRFTPKTFCFLSGITITLCFSLLTDWHGNGPAFFIENVRAQESGAQQPAQPPPQQTPAQPAPQQETKPSLMVAGKFTGVNEPDGIKLVAETSAFKHLLQIAAIANKEVKTLRVEVAPFTGPNSIQSNITWKVNNDAGDKPVTVPGLNSIPLELSSNLPIAGNYESTIWLIYEEKRWPIKLTVTRTRTAPSVEVLGVEVTRDSATMSSANSSIWLTLHEKAGRQVTLNLPTLTSLALIQSDKSKVQAKYDSIQTTCLEQDCKVEKGSLILSPGQTVHLNLTVVGLEDSGEYGGNLRVSGPDGDPIDTPITILRRRSAWFAGFLIALGVGLSFFLRHYASSVRPRLIRQREALGLKQDLDGLKRTENLTADEQEVLEHLFHQVRDLIEDIATVRDINAEQIIKDVKAKAEIFPRWVQERGRVQAVSPADLQKEFVDALNKVKAFMYVSPITEEGLKEARAALDGIAPGIKVKIKEDLAKKVTAFKNDLNSLRNTTSSHTVKARLTNEVEPRINSVEALLRTDEKLKEANAAYSEARLAYVRILCEEIRTSLPEKPPLGFDATEWQTLKQEVTSDSSAAEKATDPDEAMKSYLSIYSRYVRELAWKLQKRIENAQELIAKNASISPEDKAKYKGMLDGVDAALRQALAKVDSGDVRGAAADYELGRKTFVEVDADLKAVGGVLAASVDEAAPAEAASAGSVPGPFSLPFLGAFAKTTKTPTLLEVTRQLGWGDLIFTVIILLIAVFMGLQLLWVGNPTWGGWDAYLSAVLWGLGLHQVSGAAFEGLQGLAGKFSSG
jgi:hypothetical protein